MKTLKVKDREINLRIYSRYIKMVQKELPEDMPIAQAVIEAMSDPVGVAVPFLWGVIQDRNSDEVVPIDKAYEIYDDLVDEGKAPADFSKIVLDICQASGFFDQSGYDAMLAYIDRIKTIQKNAATGLVEKALEKPKPKPKQKPKSKPSAN
jgi:hypothetical protein